LITGIKLKKWRDYMKKSWTLCLILGVLVLLVSTCTKEKQESTEEVNQLAVKKELFGKTGDGTDVYLYTLTNENGMTVKVITLGAIVTSLTAPDRNGRYEDVVLGFDNLKSYLDGHPYFGAIVGRYGNRIAKGRFELDGAEYTLATNNGNNHLHGGLAGFDKKVWIVEINQSIDFIGLTLSYLSQDMEEGYPGNLSVSVTYTLTKDDELKIDYEAETDKATPVNITHHGYFNLTACRENILNHEVTIMADRFTVVDEELIPTGELRDVEGTDMDFRTPMTVEARIANVEGGYDHNYVLNKTGEGMVLAARVFEATSGRQMEVYTTEPGMQFYTGNFLDGSLKGKGGKVYQKHFGFCMETQHFPDSPNQPTFPTVILRPGEKYTHSTVYKFMAK
jgi:aldose 1-epimerase